MALIETYLLKYVFLLGGLIFDFVVLLLQRSYSPRPSKISRYAFVHKCCNNRWLIFLVETVTKWPYFGSTFFEVKVNFQ